MTTAQLIRVLTAAALFALLLAVGLRLTWREVATAIRRSRFVAILVVNFVWVPALTLAIARSLALPEPIIIGVVLLAAAPFAPMVPIFAQLARADLALAAGLTALLPIFSALLTPLVCLVFLKTLGSSGELRFNFPAIFAVLTATVTLPLAVGMAVRHLRRPLAERILRPIEVLAQLVGVLALALVTVNELKTVTGLGWKPLLVMTALTELHLWSGYAFGGTMAAERRSVALGTGCRNLALAVLIAVNSFPGSHVAGVVVANGLLFIGLALGHVAWWRWRTET
jgi:BASS family bile acid:Na+ symporter